MPLKREEIAAATRAQGKIQRPADYVYGAKVSEWDATLSVGSQLTRDEFIRSVEPRSDRLLVQLIKEEQAGAIILTDHKPLIGGCRKARVLKTGPGRWIEGEWWFTRHMYDWKSWEWIPGYRRPVSVTAGQIVLIGNWVDLEVEDVALCQEMDVRAVVGNESWPS